MRRIAVALLLALAAAPPLPGAQAAHTVSIAAASDLQAVLPQLVSRFERDTGNKVAVSFGSSGNFFAQIQNGAPFDLFFSADIEYPKRLVASGYADGASLYEYAAGRIVVWTRNGSGIDVKRGLGVLKDAKVRRIAIANPQHAPYGRAAEAALRHEQLYDAVKAKLVLGENISQTAQLVDSGNADVGILALALARGPALAKSGTYAEIAAGLHPPIEQAAVVVTASRNKEAARAFLAYMRQPDVGQVLRQFGFTTPGTAAR